MFAIQSPAKVNLFLNIISKSNGYHNLQSYFCLLNLCDHINASYSKSTKCFMLGRNMDSSNIVIKAIKYIKVLHNIKENFSINIKKHIPIGSGLGGVSSNAATTLKLLEKTLHLTALTKKNLEYIAYFLGADVPFFYLRKNAFVEGIGENISPIELGEKFFILLISPNVKCFSKDIFSLWDGRFSSAIDCTKNSILNQIFNGKNDLEPYVRKKYVLVDDLLNFIRAQKKCLVSRMSGSGSSCFGIFEKREDLLNAKSAAEKLYGKNLVYYEKLLL